MITLLIISRLQLHRMFCQTYKTNANIQCKHTISRHMLSRNDSATNNTRSTYCIVKGFVKNMKDRIIVSAFLNVDTRKVNNVILLLAQIHINHHSTNIKIIPLRQNVFNYPISQPSCFDNEHGLTRFKIDCWILDIVRLNF